MCISKFVKRTKKNPPFGGFFKIFIFNKIKIAVEIQKRLEIFLSSLNVVTLFVGGDFIPVGVLGCLNNNIMQKKHKRIHDA